MRALGRVSSGVAASAVLLTLLVGVPWFLSAGVGWPLPRAVPAWNDVTGTLAGDLPLDADTVWKVLACVVWVAWVQILAAAVVEAAALARGGVANPIRGLAHMQGITGPLLGAAALLLPGSLSHPASSTPGPAASTARTLVAQIEEPPAPPPGPPRPEPSTAAPALPATIEHTVVRRDTLWDLAERYLAPGRSNEEIAAAVQTLYDLNAGVPQPDGGTLTDASRIRRGWVLRIPATGALAPAAVGDNGTTAATVLVQPGDSLWEIAEDSLGDGLRYPELFDLNAGRPQSDGEALTDPSLIRPGWNIQLPASPGMPTNPPPAHPAPSELPAPAAADTPPPAPEPPMPETQLDSPSADVPTTATPSAPETAVTGRPQTPARATADEDRDDQGSSVGALGAAGGLLGAGLAVAFATRRRRRRVQRLPGTELPPLPAEAGPILDAIDDDDLDVGAGIDRAIRRLASAVADRNAVPVPIVGTIDGTTLELLLERGDLNPPEGWTTAADGRIWRGALDLSDAEPVLDPAWLPTLVSVGALDAGGLLLNLEAVGSVGLVGDPGAAIALATSIAVELGVTPLADLPAVHVVGNTLDGDVAELPGIHQHPDLASAIAAAGEETAGIADALTETGAPNVFDLRCRAPEEAWQPAVIVLAADEAGPDATRELVERCGIRNGLVAVIVGACPAGAVEIAVTADDLSIPALGLRCVPQQVDLGAVAAMASLLDAADAPCEPPGEPGPLTLFEADELDGSDDFANSEPKLRLRLLGPITADGVDLRPQQLALLAFLALHPDVTADAMRDALWGGREPTRERFLNTVHGLRRAIGADLLPPSTDNRYRLHGVSCDMAEVERRTTAASADPDNAAEELRAALELVSGTPLTYDTRHRRHFRWVDVGNHASRWERIVGDAAHDLVALALAKDDADLARWAAERGLLASPANETLTCDLVAAHLAAGDRRAAELVVEEYARVLEDIGTDEPPEALQELLEPRRAS